MDLVINISECTYRAKQRLVANPKMMIDEVDIAIANGTPLPKGHGALKDTDAICKDIISALGIRDENYLLEAEYAVYKRIKNAPTIIAADNLESEKHEHMTSDELAELFTENERDNV